MLVARWIAVFESNQQSVWYRRSATTSNDFLSVNSSANFISFHSYNQLSFTFNLFAIDVLLPLYFCSSRCETDTVYHWHWLSSNMENLNVWEWSSVLAWQGTARWERGYWRLVSTAKPRPLLPDRNPSRDANINQNQSFCCFLLPRR